MSNIVLSCGMFLLGEQNFVSMLGAYYDRRAFIFIAICFVNPLESSYSILELSWK